MTYRSSAARCPAGTTSRELKFCGSSRTRSAAGPMAASMARSTESASFTPPVPKIFTPLSCHGLCDAVIIAAGQPCCGGQPGQRRCGHDTQRHRFGAALAQPGQHRRLQRGTRLAGVAADHPRPTTQHRGRGAGQRGDVLGGQFGERHPAHTVGPELQAHAHILLDPPVDTRENARTPPAGAEGGSCVVGPCPSINAWCTAWPYGP